MENVTVDDAVRVIRRDYLADVEGVVEGVREAWAYALAEGNDFDVLERVEADVDGHQRVIYTFQAKLGLLSSDNEDAYQDFGYELPTVEARMFCAMVRDVMSSMEADYSDGPGGTWLVRVDGVQAASADLREILVDGMVEIGWSPKDDASADATSAIGWIKREIGG